MHHNGLKTAALLGPRSAFILVIGAQFGTTGLLLSLVIAIATNGYAYFKSDRLALRAMRAYPVSEGEQPAMYRNRSPNAQDEASTGLREVVVRRPEPTPVVRAGGLSVQTTRAVDRFASGAPTALLASFLGDRESTNLEVRR